MSCGLVYSGICTWLVSKEYIFLFNETWRLNMRLQPGDKAVPFSAETIEGKAISLELFAGKPLLLMFYRYASCPMCNLRLRDFAQHYSSLHEHGLEVIAFFHSTAQNIRRNAGKQNY